MLLQRNTARLVLVAASCALSVSGCASKPSTSLAAGSRIAYTTAQSDAALAAMQTVLSGATDVGATIALLPADGIRWSDLSQAITQAGASPGIDLAIASSMHIGIATRYELLTIEGWPGVLQAAPQGKGIVLGASIGPYPNQPASINRAARLVEMTHQRLLVLGRIPKVKPYTVE